MTAAALGAGMKLETFDGVQDIDIKPGTQPGETITLRGLGVTHLRAGGRGDLLVHTDVRTPTKLDAEQEGLLRQLAALRHEEAPTGKLSAPGDHGFMGKLRDAFKPR